MLTKIFLVNLCAKFQETDLKFKMGHVFWQPKNIMPHQVLKILLKQKEKINLMGNRIIYIWSMCQYYWQQDGVCWIESE